VDLVSKCDVHLNFEIVLQPVEKLSKQRPLGNIFNFYVLLSVLLQFAVHIAALLYISNLSEATDPYVAGQVIFH
jgi:magnesium-transporting ATPase (P-type)